MYPQGLGRSESPKNKRAAALAKGETHKGEQEAVPYAAAAAPQGLYPNGANLAERRIEYHLWRFYFVLKWWKIVWQGADIDILCDFLYNSYVYII